MAYAFRDDGVLDYFFCNYGNSRHLFRGPMRDTSGAFIALLGGETGFGRFVEYPYAFLIEEALDVPVVNLSGANSGPDFHVLGAETVEFAQKAVLSVAELANDVNFSNRYFSVHPRRNDRFVNATPALRALYPGLDFTEYSFTQHLLGDLFARDPATYESLLPGLREDWFAINQALLRKLGARNVVLWVRPKMSLQADATRPALVTEKMVGALADFSASIVTVTPSEAVDQDGIGEMIFSTFEAGVAATLPNPTLHREISKALLPCLQAQLSWTSA